MNTRTRNNMKFRELIESVPFDEVAPCIENMEDGFPTDPEPYKRHLEMLLSLDVRQGVDEVCHIAMDYDDFDDRMRVEVFDVAADDWDNVLAMQVEIDPDVKASRGEIVARCLWQTAKYGFTQEQKDLVLSAMKRDVRKMEKGAWKEHGKAK